MDKGFKWMFAITSILCVFAIILAIWVNSRPLKQFEEQLNQYSIIVIDGIEYDVDDIKNYEYQCNYYKPNVIVLTMRDGSKIYLNDGDYMLTNTKRGDR